MEPQAWWGIFERSGRGFAIGAPDGTFVTMNPAHAEMHGYSVEELSGKPIATILTPEWCEKLPELMRAAHEGGDLSLEVVHARKDGTTFPVQADVVVARDADGRVLYRAAWVQDITERKRAEDALRASEERLRDIFEAGFEGIVIHDNGTVLDANPQFEKMSGYKLSEIIGSSGVQLAAEESRDLIRQKIRLHPGAPFEAVGLRKDGSSIHVEAVGRDHTYQGRRVRAVVVRDITERKRAEEELRESEAKFRTLAETMPALVFIIQGSTLPYVNSAVEAATGYTRGELVTMNVLDLVHPDHRELVSAGAVALRPDERDLLRNELKLLTKDGEERWFDITGSVMEFEGRPALLGTAFDITERKRAEEALRESEERYRSLYTKTPAMLHSIDTEGRVIAVNDRWLEVLGYERNEVIGRKVVGFLTDDSRRFAETVGGPRFWKVGSARDVPYRFVKKNGEVADVLLSAVVERDGAGNAVSSLAVLNDVTERKRLEEALQRAREELEGKIERQMVRRNPYGLTFREFHVLHLVAAGRADKEIARELSISPLTVQKHVANILGKMNAASRTEGRRPGSQGGAARLAAAAASRPRPLLCNISSKRTIWKPVGENLIDRPR